MNMHKSPDQGAGVPLDEQPDIHIEEVPEYPEKCIECMGDHIIKWGFTGKGESRRQRYMCKNPECECATFVYRGGFERMRKPVWAILQAFNDFFKGHTPKDVADTLAKGMQIPELEQLMGHAAQDVADAIVKLKCEVNRSSIYRWFAKFIPITHEYLRQIPIRTGEHVAADEVCMSGDDDEDDEDGVKKSAAADAPPEEPDETLAAEDVHAADAPPEESKRKKRYLFSTTEISTRFCLAFEMADRKDGFNATNLLKETLGRTGKVPAVFTTDCLPSYSEAHQAVFAAKNPLDKHSVHVGDSCLHNKKKHNKLSGTVQRDVPQIPAPQTEHPKSALAPDNGLFCILQFRPTPLKPERAYAGRGGRHHNPRGRQVEDQS